MSYLTVNGSTIVGQGKRAKLVRYIRKIDITGKENRKNDMCRTCGSDVYPNCGCDCDFFKYENPYTGDE